MFHLALYINDKYLFDKQEVFHFEPKNPITSKSETLDVFLPNDFDLTIRELLVKTKEFMGDKPFNSYDAFENNCQEFLVGIMKANNLDDETYIKFIKQDGKAVLKKLPKYKAKMSRLLTDIGAVAENKSVSDMKMRSDKDMIQPPPLFQFPAADRPIDRTRVGTVVGTPCPWSAL